MPILAPLLTLVLVLAPPPPPPRTLRVPSEITTIQAAVDSAVEGDTVLVAPGHYYENVRLRGRNIVLASEFIRSRRDSSLIARTIIDGSRPRHPDSGTVVSIYQFEDSTTVVEGFTITGGTGTVWYDNKDKIFFREGGGILIDLAGPTLRNNVITENVAVEVAPNSPSSGGGGIRIGFADPILEANVITKNRGRYGGGIVLFHSAARLTRNIVRDNSGGEDFGGGGVWIRGHLSRRLVNLLDGNVIERNAALPHDGGGHLRRVPPVSGKGGGIAIGVSNTVLKNNRVRDNKPNDVEGNP